MQTSSAAARIQANLEELFKAKLTPGDAYIKFKLTPEITALLSMQQVQESLIVKAEAITPLPTRAKFMIGMISSRDRVFCIFDLAELLNLSFKLIAPRQYQIIVLQTQSQQPIHVGLAVTELQGIMRIPTEEICPPMEVFTDELVPFLKGAVVKEGIKMPILKFELILQALNAIDNG